MGFRVRPKELDRVKETKCQNRAEGGFAFAIEREPGQLASYQKAMTERGWCESGFHLRW